MQITYEVPGELLARCIGRYDLVRRVLSSFVEQLGTDISILESELASGDGDSATRTAHRIKGAASNVEAEYIRSTAESIEKLASAGILDEACTVLGLLRSHRKDFAALTAEFIQVEEPSQCESF